MRPSTRTMCLAALLAGALACALLSAAARTQEPQTKEQAKPEYTRLIPSLNGPDLFHAHCAPCHGADGTGNGPVAAVLLTRVPDLTTLAKRNGGTFPRARVEKIISGDDVLIAHGSRDMPIWGQIFHQIEVDRDYGHIRLTNVVKYIESIQQK